MSLTGGSTWASTTTMNGPRPTQPAGNQVWAQPGARSDEAMASNDAYAQAMAQMGYDPAMYQNQQQGLMGQIMLALQQSGMTAAQMQQQFGFDAAGLGLQGQSNAATAGFIGQREGLSQQELANQLAGYGINKEQAQQSAATDIRNNDSAAVSAGAIFSPMSRLRNEDTRSSLDQQMRQIGLGEQGARLDAQGRQIGFDEQRSQLDIAAQQLGITRQELEANLANALQQNNMNTGLDVMGLMGQLGQAGQDNAANMYDLAILAQQLYGQNQATGNVPVGPNAGPPSSMTPYANMLPSTVTNQMNSQDWSNAMNR